MRFRLLASGLVLTLSACTYGDVGTQIGRIEETVCDDGAACAQGFTLDGVAYSLSCTAIRTDRLTATLGNGSLAGTAVEGRSVAGATPETVIAITTPEGACGETGARTGWVTAISVEARGNDEVLEVLCQVGDLTVQQQRANGCPR